MPTTSLMPLPKQQFLSAVGVPLVGGSIYTYAAGTNNPKATYTDSAGTVPQANPIPLNARGEPNSPIYWSGAYKVEVRDLLGNVVYTVDNFNTDPAGVWGFMTNLASTVGASLMGFLQAGVGAVKRTVQDRLRDAINVKDYGAKGDGVTDDTAAIQAAFNAAKTIALSKPAYGIVVFFPAGTYKTTATITVPAYVNVMGETVEGVIITALFNGDAFQDETIGGASYLYFTRFEEISIFKSNTDGTGNTTGKAINFHHNASFCQFRRLRIYGGEYAIYGENLGYSLWNTFENVFMDKQTIANLYLGQGSNATNAYGCQFHGAPVGLDAPGSSFPITLTACHFESYTICSVRTDNAQIIILGGYNEFKNALESAFIINGTGTVDVIGAYMKGAGAGYIATLNGNGFVRVKNCLIVDYSYAPPFAGAYASNFELASNSVGGTTNTLAKGTEKGTFVPVLSFSIPGDLAVTYGTQVGRYSKVGNRVTLDVQIVTTAFTWATAAGYLRITGIPYQGNATAGAQSKGAMSYSGLTKAGYTQIHASIDSTNRAQLIAFASGSGVAMTTVNAADLPSGTNKTINLSITYETEW